MNTSEDTVLAIVSIVTFIAGYFLISRLIDWFRKTTDLSNRPTIVAPEEEPSATSIPTDTGQRSQQSPIDVRQRDIDEKFRKELQKRDAQWDKYKRTD